MRCMKVWKRSDFFFVLGLIFFVFLLFLFLMLFIFFDYNNEMIDCCFNLNLVKFKLDVDVFLCYFFVKK